MTERIETPPVAEWGKDHWSTLAYAETRIVDHRGLLNNDHMRADPDRHPNLALGAVKASHGFKPTKYPTRLKDRELPDHDDWDCIEDMMREGMIVVTSKEGVDTLLDYPERHLTVALTEKGYEVAAQLRKHKAEGGGWGDFQPRLEEVAA